MSESELFSGSGYCEEEHIIFDREPSLDAEELSLQRFHHDPEGNEDLINIKTNMDD